MYSIFTRRLRPGSSVTSFAAFDLVRRVLANECNRIEGYYHSRVYSVRNEHLLCRMINLCMAPMDYSPERFVDVVMARAPYIARNLGLTDSINQGKFHKGVFYGDIQELIFDVYDSFDLTWASANWEKLKPITVLAHPVSDFGLTPLTGKKRSTATGFAAIQINIPMLVFQFRCFLKRSIIEVDDVQKANFGVQQFVHQYPITGMIPSHTELVCLNRLKNLFYGLPNSRALSLNPFAITDMSTKVDDVMENVLRKIIDANIPYEGALTNIPSLFEDDMQEVLLMPRMSLTRQVWWALFYTRLKDMAFLFDVGGVNGVKMNRQYINEFKVMIDRFRSDGALRLNLPPQLYDEASTMITRMIDA